MPNHDDGAARPRCLAPPLFEQVGFAGAVAAPVTATAPGVMAMAAVNPRPPQSQRRPRRRRGRQPQYPRHRSQRLRLEALETLTAAEADTLEAIVARLIPTDENGPGATEARAAHYIDRALTGPLRSSRASYAANLAAIDVYAQAKKGAPFARLAAADQDSALTDMEKNVATGFSPNAAAFFVVAAATTSKISSSRCAKHASR